MNYKITATAPTSYQFNSLLAFGIGYRKNLNGSLTAEQEFETEEEAKEYLKDRADMYFETEYELNEALDQIEKYGCLTIDAVTAEINTNEE